MKKFIAIAVLAIVCLTTNAQCYLGAGIGFGTSKADYDHAQSTTLFQISPEFGYNFNSKWAIGVDLKFTSVSSGSDYTTFGGDKEGSVTSISLRPGVSANLGKGVNLAGRMNLVDYSMYSKKAGDCNVTSFGIRNADAIAPFELALIFDL